MRKIMIAIGILFSIITVIIAVRTMRFVPVSTQIAPVAMSYNPEMAFRHLSEAVTFKTVSRDTGKIDGVQFTAFHDFLQRSFPLVHAKMKRETVNTYSLLYTWEGKSKTRPAHLFLAHMDVVPVEQGTETSWKHGPFSGDRADGCIWGRGTLDNKCNLLGLLEAAEELLRRGFVPDGTIYIASGHDEEVGGKEGSGAIAALMKTRGVKLAAVIDEGAVIAEGMFKGVNKPIALIGIAEKGTISLELSVKSDGGHSSMPPPETALGILSGAVSRVEKNQFPNRISSVTRLMLESIGPEMPFVSRLALGNLWLFDPYVKSLLARIPATAALLHTTIAPTMMQGSAKENVLPARVFAVINFRIFPEDTRESVRQHVLNSVNDPRVTIRTYSHSYEPSPVSDAGSDAYRTLQKTILQVYPGTVVTPFLVNVRTDSLHFAGISSQVFRFVPFRFTSADLSMLHGANERVSLSQYEQAVKFFMQLMKNSSGR